MADVFDEKAVFLAALRVAPADRESFLRGACPDESARVRIEALLRHHTATTDAPARAAGAGPDPSTFEQIDEFKLLRRVGEGGMGAVFLAEDTVLGRQVALKVLAPHLTGSEQALGRFREEARSAAVLNHPGIVPVFKMGYDGRVHYIVSEFVDGPTLAQIIDEERVRRRAAESTQAVRAWLRRSAETALAVADALECSHRARIIHRDVKPSNILIDPQRGPRLTDFGIAKHLSEEARTRSTGVVGSCHYMSPEQAAIAGAKVDQRSDIFSLGVILYEMLCLRRPFDGPDMRQVLHAVVTAEPTRLRATDQRIPKDLETICHTAIEKQPDRRYQTAAHFAADLRCYLEGRPILARPPGVMRRTGRWAQRHRRVLWPAAVGALAITGLAMGVALDQNRRAAETRRLESLAWVSVECRTPGCLVFLQPVDARTLEPGPPEYLGRTPVGQFQRTPGQYRMSIVEGEGDGFAEFNLLLLEPGEASRTHVRCGAPAPAEGGEPGAGAAGAPSRVLKGDLGAPSDAIVGNMALVPAGDYIFGWSDDGDPRIGRRTVSLAAFYIDRTEVSNGEYKAFIDATGHDPPLFWRTFGYDESLADHPVVWVSLEDAEAYARWRGKRLPTALEWQGAVRGPQGRLYPWDRDPGAAIDRLEPDAAEEAELRAIAGDPADLIKVKANGPAALAGLYDVYRRRTVPVGRADPLTDVGQLVQVYGNVEETTASVRLPGRGAITQGRCWRDPVRTCTLGSIWTVGLGESSFDRGFRCAKSAAPPAVDARN